MISLPPILVTGGAGFIGGCFVRRKLAAGRRIINLDKLTYAASPEALPPESDSRHRLIAGDIADRALVRRLLCEHRPSAVVNFAAESHVDRSLDGPADFINTNIVGAFHLLETVWDYWTTLTADERAGFRFLQISTDEVFGALGPTGRFDEDSPYRPNSPYAASKAAADHLVRAYGQSYGLPVLLTHASNNYGPFQHPEKLIPLMTLNALQRAPLPVYGDGAQVRDWLHVDDHCRALELILDNAVPGASYAVGAGCERTNLQVVQQICDLIDELSPAPGGGSTRELIRFVADRPGHDRRYALNNQRLVRELGWTPRHRFDQGLRETVAWWIANSQGRGNDGERRRLGLQRQAASQQRRIEPTRP